MGGKVLELESERLIRIGKAEGENLSRSLKTKLLGAGRISDAELAAKERSQEEIL